MKKNASKTTPAKSATKRGKGYGQLVTAISAINTQMVTRVATVANQALVLRNWMVGAYIVEFEQEGADRAKYGARLLPTLATDLAAKGAKGLGAEVLRTCRLFFLSYPEISHAMRGKFEMLDLDPAISHTVRGKLRQPVLALNSAGRVCGIGESVVGQLKQEPKPDSPITGLEIRRTAVAERPTPLTADQLARISWGHFLELIRTEDPWKRAFYENEIINGHWSVRQLQRQIESLLYERTGLSTNNWFKARMMAEGDNPPVGILLCSDKDGAEVEFATAGMDQQLFVSRYLTQLPSAAQLKAFLERDRAEIKALTQRER